MRYKLTLLSLSFFYKTILNGNIHHTNSYKHLISVTLSFVYIRLSIYTHTQQYVYPIYKAPHAGERQRQRQRGRPTDDSLLTWAGARAAFAQVFIWRGGKRQQRQEQRRRQPMSTHEHTLKWNLSASVAWSTSLSRKNPTDDNVLLFHWDKWLLLLCVEHVHTHKHTHILRGEQLNTRERSGNESAPVLLGCPTSACDCPHVQYLRLCLLETTSTTTSSSSSSSLAASKHFANERNCVRHHHCWTDACCEQTRGRLMSACQPAIIGAYTAEMRDTRTARPSLLVSFFRHAPPNGKNRTNAWTAQQRHDTNNPVTSIETRLVQNRPTQRHMKTGLLN